MKHNLKFATVLLVGALLSACGSAGDTANPGGTSTPRSFDDYQLAFAQCMREHGIDMPDPAGGGRIQAPAIDDMTAFTEASEACQDELGPPPAPDGQAPKSDEERLAEMVQVAECFREHGIEMPDPKQGEALSIPMDAPEDVLAACAPEGISGPATRGGN